MLDLDLPIECHNEDNFFLKKYNVTKENLLQNLTIKNDLYSKGWFYQQCLKIGANDIIKLPDKFMVWDADMLPVNPWPVSDNKFALLPEDLKRLSI